MADGTQYLIQIAARMNGADATVTQLESLAKGLSGAGTAAVKLDKTLEHTKGIASASHEAERGSLNFRKLKGGLADLGGPLGKTGAFGLNLADAFEDLTETIGFGAGALIGGVVALTAVIAAFVVGVGVAIFKTAEWAIGLADASRSAGLATEAVEQTSERLRGLSDILPGIERDTGLAASELTGLAKQLDKAKVSAKSMPAALRAVALAESALGKGGAADFIDDLKAGRTTVGALAKDVEQKFGGIVARKMIGLGETSKRLKRNLAETFGGLKIEPLLEGLQTLVALFDKNTAAGETIKFLFETIFQPLIDGIVKAIPFVEAFFLGLLIGGLKIYIALKPAIRALKDLFGFEPDASLEETLAVVTKIGEIAAGVFVGVAAAGATMMAMILAIPAAFFALGYAAAAAFDTLRSSAAKAVDWLRSVSLADIGTAMVQGLANGIMAAAGRVVEAIGGVVKGAISSAKRLLGIASPSKVFEGLGGFTAEGFAGGVEDGTPGARSALEGMVEPPRARAAGQTSQGAGLNMAGATFNFYGVKDAEDAEGRFGGLLTRIIEGDLVQLGGFEPEPEGAT